LKFVSNITTQVAGKNVARQGFLLLIALMAALAITACGGAAPAPAADEAPPAEATSAESAAGDTVGD
jgi:hypothetical protein